MNKIGPAAEITSNDFPPEADLAPRKVWHFGVKHKTLISPFDIPRGGVVALGVILKRL